MKAKEFWNRYGRWWPAVAWPLVWLASALVGWSDNDTLFRWWFGTLAGVLLALTGWYAGWPALKLLCSPRPRR